MKSIFEVAEKLCKERGFNCFFLKKPSEVWISGYIFDKKFDIFIRELPDGNIKLIFEVPEERKPILFKDEESVIKRLYLLVEEKEETKEEITEEQIFTKLTGLMSDDKLVEMYLQNKNKENLKEIS